MDINKLEGLLHKEALRYQRINGILFGAVTDSDSKIGALKQDILKAQKAMKMFPEGGAGHIKATERYKALESQVVEILEELYIKHDILIEIPRHPGSPG